MDTRILPALRLDLLQLLDLVVPGPDAAAHVAGGPACGRAVAVEASALREDLMNDL